MNPDRQEKYNVRMACRKKRGRCSEVVSHVPLRVQTVQQTNVARCN
jgi:hypothetical protein